MDNSNYSIDSEEGKLLLTVDVNCYSLEVIYSACYKFLDSVYIFLKSDGEDEIKVELKPKEDSSKSDLESLAGEFFNELLSMSLRESIASRNKKLREYVMGTVILGSSREARKEFLDQEQEVAGGAEEQRGREGGKQQQDTNEVWEDDPLDIATPWEKRHQSEGEEGENQDSSEEEITSGAQKEEGIKEEKQTEQEEAVEIWKDDPLDIATPWEDKHQSQDQGEETEE